MHTIAIVVSTSAAGLVGWSSRSSSKMAALIGAAGGRGRQLRTALPQVDAAQGWRSSARWALAVAVPTGIVAAGLPVRGHGALPPLGRLALVVWAATVTVLALIDRDSLVIPTKMVRGAIFATTALLFLGSAGAGAWHYFWPSAVCASVAAGLFAPWAAMSPRGLGFGDVRMAVLVALGAGAVSVPGSLTALACSPLLAGVVGKLHAGPGPLTRARPWRWGPIWLWVV